MRGSLRKEIMDKCPEGFEDDLKDFIDKIEDKINNIQDNMSVKSLSDLSNIACAAGDLDTLADSLY